MLYLPPGVAHDGVAEGECMTYSIGFRAPAFADLLDPWLARFRARRAARRPLRRSPASALHRGPPNCRAAMVAAVHAALGRARPPRADTERFLLEYLSEPKPHVVFDRPRRAPSAAAFARGAGRRGVVLDGRTRMLTGRPGVAVNGELFEVESRLLPELRKLADRRSLAAADIRRAPGSLPALLLEWAVAGWLHLAPPPRS